jgi:hypothetical protein
LSRSRRDTPSYGATLSSAQRNAISVSDPKAAIQAAALRGNERF